MLIGKWKSRWPQIYHVENSYNGYDYFLNDYCLKQESANYGLGQVAYFCKWSFAGTQPIQLHTLEEIVCDRDLYGRQSQRNLLAFRKFSDPGLNGTNHLWCPLWQRFWPLPVWVLHALSWSSRSVHLLGVFRGAGSALVFLGALCLSPRDLAARASFPLSGALWVLFLEAVGFGPFWFASYLGACWRPFCVFFSFDTSLGPFFTLWKASTEFLESHHLTHPSSDGVWRFSGWSSEKWGSMRACAQVRKCEPECEPRQPHSHWKLHYGSLLLLTVVPGEFAQLSRCSCSLSP